jgi:hypothetical protein
VLELSALASELCQCSPGTILLAVAGDGAVGSGIGAMSVGAGAGRPGATLLAVAGAGAVGSGIGAVSVGAGAHSLGATRIDSEDFGSRLRDAGSERGL